MQWCSHQIDPIWSRFSFPEVSNAVNESLPSELEEKLMKSALCWKILRVFGFCQCSNL